MARLPLLIALIALMALTQAHGSLTSAEYIVRNLGRVQCTGQCLGFNNRTCAAGTSTRPAGPGVGPDLRPATATNSWTTLTVTLTGEDLAVLSTFFSPSSPAQPRCMGNLVAEKAAACADPRVHIHPATQAGADTPWLLTAVSGGAYTIAYTGRGEGCAVYLTASAACGTAAPFLAPADGSALQLWALTPTAPAASPPAASPPSPPLAGQPPSLAIATTSPTSAFATVSPPPGGCTPVAYEISHKLRRSLDAPSVTTLRGGALTASLGNLLTGSEYEATAVGVCADGTRTPPSAPATFTPAPPPACPDDPADRAGVELFAPGGKDNDYGGGSVAVDGDTAVFGAYSWADDNDNDYVGRALVFSRAEGAGWAWQQTLTLEAPYNAPSAYFGKSLILEGDNLLVFSNYNGDNEGAAWVFRRGGGGIFSPTGQVLTSRFPGPNTYFGESMALRGGTLAIGGGDEVYMYTRSANRWVEQARMVPTATGGLFGRCGVAVDGDGATVVVGNYAYNGEDGAAFVYTKTGGAWAEHQILTVAKGAYARMAGNVAIDGGVILADAQSTVISTPGSYYVFARSGADWALAQHLLPPALTMVFGYGAVAFSGGTALIGDDNYNSNTGAVFVYTWNGTGLEPKVGPNGSFPLTNKPGTGFGEAVALSTGNTGAHCDTIMVGATYTDGPGGSTYQGTAVMYPM